VVTCYIIYAFEAVTWLSVNLRKMLLLNFHLREKYEDRAVVLDV